MLLREWRSGRTREGQYPYLQFPDNTYPPIHDAIPVSVPDLLADWPETVPERIERSFRHLVCSSHRQFVGGKQIEIGRGKAIEQLLFTEFGQQELDYFIKAMTDYRWVESTKLDEYGGYRICITPKGWTRFDEFNRGHGAPEDPVFVAMWFGKSEHEQDRFEEMKTLFEDAIKPACKASGFKAKRADCDDHNDPIMDKVLYSIRKAPFVVADLTNNNQGVYYEAGLATGWGKAVIFCRPTSEKQCHFDIAGINQIIYEDGDLEALRRKLEDRVKATMGEGPHRTEN